MLSKRVRLNFCSRRIPCNKGWGASRYIGVSLKQFNMLQCYHSHLPPRGSASSLAYVELRYHALLASARSNLRYLSHQLATRRACNIIWVDGVGKHVHVVVFRCSGPCRVHALHVICRIALVDYTLSRRCLHGTKFCYAYVS